MQADRTDAAGHWPSPARAHYALGILILALTFSFIDRTILAMLVTPIKKDLDLSDTQVSLLQGFAFVMLYVVMGFPLGRLIDRRSRRSLAAMGILLWSLMTAACGLAHSFVMLGTARMGVGIGEAVLSPAAYSLIADYYRPAQRARALAMFSLGALGGASLAYFVGGAVIAFAHGGPETVVPVLGGLAPWRLTFIAVGLPGVIVALLMFTVTEPPRHGLGSGSKCSATTQVISSDTTPTLFTFVRANRATLASYLLGYGLLNMPFSAIIAWGPSYFSRVHGFTPRQTGLTLGLCFLFAGAVGQFVGAFLSDRGVARGVRTAAFRTAIACSAALTLVGFFAPIASSVSWNITLTGGIILLASAAIAHAPSVIPLIAPNGIRGQVSAVYLLGINLIGSALAPTLIALLTDYVFRDQQAIGWSMAIVSGLGAAGACLSFWLGLGPLTRSIAANTNGTGTSYRDGALPLTAEGVTSSR